MLNYEDLYSDPEEDIDNIIKMKKIKHCTVLEQGMKKQLMDFYFCSCDPDQKDPICLACAESCHRGDGHILSKKYRSLQVCLCGYKNHKFEKQEIEGGFSTKCCFYELSQKSGLYTYYKAVNSNFILCIICFSICKQKLFNIGRMIKKQAPSESQVPPCECYCKNHTDIKSTYKMVNMFFSGNELSISSNKMTTSMNFQIFTFDINNHNSTSFNLEKKVDLEYLTPSQTLNCIFQSKTLRNTLYNALINILEKINSSENFEFDSRIGYSNQFLALLNVSNLAKFELTFPYYSEKVRALFDIEILYKIIKKSFDPLQTDIWRYKILYLESFFKIVLFEDINKFPQYSLNDYENMSPFQRLQVSTIIQQDAYFMKKYLGVCDNSDKYMNINPKNINMIDLILEEIETICKSNQDSNAMFNDEEDSKGQRFYRFCFLFKLCSVIKLFARFNLLKYVQTKRYLSVVEILFYQLNDFQEKRNNKLIINNTEKVKKSSKNIIMSTNLVQLNRITEISNTELPPIMKTEKLGEFNFNPLEKNENNKDNVKKKLMFFNHIPDEEERNKMKMEMNEDICDYQIKYQRTKKKTLRKESPPHAELAKSSTNYNNRKLDEEFQEKKLNSNYKLMNLEREDVKYDNNLDELKRGASTNYTALNEIKKSRLIQKIKMSKNTYNNNSQYKERKSYLNNLNSKRNNKFTSNRSNHKIKDKMESLDEDDIKRINSYLPFKKKTRKKKSESNSKVGSKVNSRLRSKDQSKMELKKINEISNKDLKKYYFNNNNFTKSFSQRSSYSKKRKSKTLISKHSRLSKYSKNNLNKNSPQYKSNNSSKFSRSFNKRVSIPENITLLDKSAYSTSKNKRKKEVLFKHNSRRSKNLSNNFYNIQNSFKNSSYTEEDKKTNNFSPKKKFSSNLNLKLLTNDFELPNTMKHITEKAVLEIVETMMFMIFSENDKKVFVNMIEKNNKKNYLTKSKATQTTKQGNLTSFINFFNKYTNVAAEEENEDLDEKKENFESNKKSIQNSDIFKQIYKNSINILQFIKSQQNESIINNYNISKYTSSLLNKNNSLSSIQNTTNIFGNKTVTFSSIVFYINTIFNMSLNVIEFYSLSLKRTFNTNLVFNFEMALNSYNKVNLMYFPEDVILKSYYKKNSIVDYFNTVMDILNTQYLKNKNFKINTENITSYNELKLCFENSILIYNSLDNKLKLLEENLNLFSIKLGKFYEKIFKKYFTFDLIFEEVIELIIYSIALLETQIKNLIRLLIEETFTEILKEISHNKIKLKIKTEFILTRELIFSIIEKIKLGVSFYKPNEERSPKQFKEKLLDDLHSFIYLLKDKFRDILLSNLIISTNLIHSLIKAIPLINNYSVYLKRKLMNENEDAHLKNYKAISKKDSIKRITLQKRMEYCMNKVIRFLSYFIEFDSGNFDCLNLFNNIKYINNSNTNNKRNTEDDIKSKNYLMDLINKANDHRDKDKINRIEDDNENKNLNNIEKNNNSEIINIKSNLNNSKDNESKFQEKNHKEAFILIAKGLLDLLNRNKALYLKFQINKVENSCLIISNCIMSSLTSTDFYCHGEKIFELIYTCLINLKSQDYQLFTCISILKYLKLFFFNENELIIIEENTQESKVRLKCLILFLKIIKLSLFSCSNAVHSSKIKLIIEIREILKDLYYNCFYLKEFKDQLIEEVYNELKEEEDKIREEEEKFKNDFRDSSHDSSSLDGSINFKMYNKMKNNTKSNVSLLALKNFLSTKKSASKKSYSLNKSYASNANNSHLKALESNVISSKNINYNINVNNNALEEKSDKKEEIINDFNTTDRLFIDEAILSSKISKKNVRNHSSSNLLYTRVGNQNKKSQLSRFSENNNNFLNAQDLMDNKISKSNKSIANKNISNENQGDLNLINDKEEPKRKSNLKQSTASKEKYNTTALRNNNKKITSILKNTKKVNMLEDILENNIEETNIKQDNDNDNLASSLKKDRDSDSIKRSRKESEDRNKSNNKKKNLDIIQEQLNLLNQRSQSNVSKKSFLKNKNTSKEASDNQSLVLINNNEFSNNIINNDIRMSNSGNAHINNINTNSINGFVFNNLNADENNQFSDLLKNININQQVVIFNINNYQQPIINNNFVTVTEESNTNNNNNNNNLYTNNNSNNNNKRNEKVSYPLKLLDNNIDNSNTNDIKKNLNDKINRKQENQENREVNNNNNNDIVYTNIIKKQSNKQVNYQSNINDNKQIVVANNSFIAKMEKSKEILNNNFGPIKLKHPKIKAASPIKSNKNSKSNVVKKKSSKLIESPKLVIKKNFVKKKTIFEKIQQKKSARYDKNSDSSSIASSNSLENSESYQSDSFLEKNELKLLEFLIHNSFKLYLELVNYVFDDSANNDDTLLLERILNEEEIMILLKNKNVDLELRTEVLKLYRIMYIESNVDHFEVMKYRNEFCKHYSLNDNTDSYNTKDNINANYNNYNNNNNLESMSFIQKLLVISQEEKDLLDGIELLLGEVKQFKSNIEFTNEKYNKNDANSKDRNNYNNFMDENEENNEFGIFDTNNYPLKNQTYINLNYLEFGIVLPLKVFINKIFSNITLIEGHEVLKVYELIYHILLIKKYVCENKSLFIFQEKSLMSSVSSLFEYSVNYEANDFILESLSNKELLDMTLSKTKTKTKTIFNLNLEHDKNIFGQKIKQSKTKGNNYFNSQINRKSLRQKLNNVLISDGQLMKELNSIKLDLSNMNKKNFKAFDLLVLFNIFDKHINSLMDSLESFNLVDEVLENNDEFEFSTEDKEDLKFQLKKQHNSSKFFNFLHQIINTNISSNINVKRELYLNNNFSSLSKNNNSNINLDVIKKSSYKPIIAMDYLNDKNTLFEINYEYCVLEDNYLEIIQQYWEEKSKSELSIVTILSEINLNLGVNYRNLLVKLLFNMVQGDAIRTYNYTAGLFSSMDPFNNDCYLLILKLLQLDTVPVQREIETIRQESGQINLYQLTDVLLFQLTGIFFSSYNYSSINFMNEYFNACVIVKIFKYLCEEHNNYFQEVLLRKLSFNINTSNKQNKRYLKKIAFKKISFFDLMLEVQGKILLVSGWANNCNSGMQQIKGDSNNGYFFDLFFCINELLIEIIQGCPAETLKEIISEETEKEVKVKKNVNSQELFFTDNNMELRQFIRKAKKKTLISFFDSIKPILINNNIKSSLMMKVKKELSEFILAFLEEKNVPLNVKQIIVDKFHVSELIKLSCQTLKSLYVNIMLTKEITALLSIATELKDEDEEEDISIEEESAEINKENEKDEEVKEPKKDLIRIKTLKRYSTLMPNKNAPVMNDKNNEKNKNYHITAAINKDLLKNRRKSLGVIRNLHLVNINSNNAATPFVKSTKNRDKNKESSRDLSYNIKSPLQRGVSRSKKMSLLIKEDSIPKSSPKNVNKSKIQSNKYILDASQMLPLKKISSNDESKNKMNLVGIKEEANNANNIINSKIIQKNNNTNNLNISKTSKNLYLNNILNSNKFVNNEKNFMYLSNKNLSNVELSSLNNALQSLNKKKDNNSIPIHNTLNKKNNTSNINVNNMSYQFSFIGNKRTKTVKNAKKEEDLNEKIQILLSSEFFNKKYFEIMSQIDLNDEIVSFLEEEYFKNSEFQETNEFKLTYCMFKITKLICLEFKTKESDNIMMKVEEIKKRNLYQLFQTRKQDEEYDNFHNNLNHNNNSSNINEENEEAKNEEIFSNKTVKSLHNRSKNLKENKNLSLISSIINKKTIKSVKSKNSSVSKQILQEDERKYTKTPTRPKSNNLNSKKNNNTFTPVKLNAMDHIKSDINVNKNSTTIGNIMNINKKIHPLNLANLTKIDLNNRLKISNNTKISKISKASKVSFNDSYINNDAIKESEDSSNNPFKDIRRNNYKNSNIGSKTNYNNVITNKEIVIRPNSNNNTNTNNIIKDISPFKNKNWNNTDYTNNIFNAINKVNQQDKNNNKDIKSLIIDNSSPTKPRKTNLLNKFFKKDRKKSEIDGQMKPNDSNISDVTNQKFLQTNNLQAEVTETNNQDQKKESFFNLLISANKKISYNKNMKYFKNLIVTKINNNPRPSNHKQSIQKNNKRSHSQRFSRMSKNNNDTMNLFQDNYNAGDDIFIPNDDFEDNENNTINITEKYFEEYFYFNFFESVTRTIQITKDDMPIRVIYNLPYKMNYLSKNSKTFFIENVNRSNRYSKLSSLIENATYFNFEMDYEFKNKNNILHSINYNYLQVFFFVIVVFCNLYLIWNYQTLVNKSRENVQVNITEYDNQIVNGELVTTILSYIKYISVYNPLLFENEYASLFDEYRDQLFYLKVSEFFINLVIFIIWCITKLPLYYKTEILKFKQKSNNSENGISISNKDDKDDDKLKKFKYENVNMNKIKNNFTETLTTWKKVKLILLEAFLNKNESVTFLWNVIFSLIFLYIKRISLFVLSLQLVSILFLSKILRNITLALNHRGKHILSMIILIFIVNFFYSSLVFYIIYFQAYNNNTKTFTCNTLIECWLVAIGSVKDHGGFGDQLWKTSYLYNKTLYFARVLLNVTNYFLIMKILTDLNLAVILESFLSMRESYNKIIYDKENVCYICGVNRNDLEKNGENFNSHISLEHNISNYVFYVISLLNSQVQDLNSINSYSYDKIQKKEISWLPHYKNLNNSSNHSNNYEAGYNEDSNKMHSSKKIGKKGSSASLISVKNKNSSSSINKSRGSPKKGNNKKNGFMSGIFRKLGYDENNSDEDTNRQENWKVSDCDNLDFTCNNKSEASINSNSL